MAPLSSYFAFPEWLNMLTALLIGTGFGFALEQAGFSSSRKLAGMFYGYDTTVIKVFFTAAIVALIGSQFLSYLGLLNLNEVYVNEFYVTASIPAPVCAPCQSARSTPWSLLQVDLQVHFSSPNLFP
jgi:hypothetical protein